MPTNLLVRHKHRKIYYTNEIIIKNEVEGLNDNTIKFKIKQFISFQIKFVQLFSVLPFCVHGII